MGRPRICIRRGILFHILRLLFFIEVQPAKRHGESTSKQNVNGDITKVEGGLIIK